MGKESRKRLIGWQRRGEAWRENPELPLVFSAIAFAGWAGDISLLPPPGNGSEQLGQKQNLCSGTCTPPGLQQFALLSVFPPLINPNVPSVGSIAKCLHPSSLQTTQECKPQTLTEMFIKIEIQNNGLEHNVSWSRISLNWFLFSMHKWKKTKQDYTKRTESAEHNKTVLMQQLFFF